MRRDDPGPYSLDVLKTLPRPSFFERDANVLKARYVAWFEQEAGRTLYPMQVEMLLIEALAHAMSLLGEEAQLSAEQHLVAFALGESQDRLGVNRSTQRLPAARAVTTLRFSIETVAPANIVLTVGTLVSSGNHLFSTDATAIIRAGALEADVLATAVESGAAANGLLPGQINALEVPIDGVSVANLTTTEGGADIESQDAYQLRIANAFDRVSSGGGYGWYRETVMGVSSVIVDCGVVRPQPCYVDLYPLTANGPAGPDLRAAVLAAFNTARALENRFGDEVTIKAALTVSRSPVLTVRVRAAGASIGIEAQEAAMAVLTDWGQRLGAMVAPHDVEAAVRKLAGVVDVEIDGLPFQQLGEGEYLSIDTITVNVEALP